MNHQLIALEELRDAELDQADPLSAEGWRQHLKAYEQHLDREYFEKNINQFRDVLVEQMSSMEKGSDGTCLTLDGMSAFPEVIHRRMLAYLLACQGAARCRIHLKDWGAAEAHCKKAIELSSKVALSPVPRALADRETQDLLLEVYRAQNLTGKALVAKLNKDLIDGYLKSPKAADHFYANRSLIFSAAYRKRFENLQEAVVKVNEARRAKALAEQIAIASAVFSTSISTMNFTSSLHSTDAVTKMMANFQLAEDVMAITDKLDKTMEGLASDENVPQSAGQAVAVSQLADRDMGADTPGLIQGFLSAVVKAGGGNLQAPAEMVRSRMEAAIAARSSKSASGTKALASFAQALEEFESKALEVK